MASQAEAPPPEAPSGDALPAEPHGELLAAQPAPEPAPQPGSGADLLTIGLLVFFVALLVIVAALLVMPRIVG